jgi:hypothetical protein
VNFKFNLKTFDHKSNFRRKIILNEKDLIFNKPLEEGVKAALMTLMTDITYRNQQTYKTFVLKVCREELMTVNIVMYFQKNFYLREAIDQKLSELNSNGILQHFIQKYSDERFNNIKFIQLGPRKLNMQHLFGIFNILLIGLAIALIIFTMEVFVSNIKRVFNLN